MTLNSMPRLLSLSISFVLQKAAPGVKTPPLEDKDETNLHKAVCLQPFPLPSELSGNLFWALGSGGLIPKPSQQAGSWHPTMS